jgi:DNA-directed RNA polymerase subunit RPC12/RpoP
MADKTCKLIKKEEYDNIYYECSNCGMDWSFFDGNPEENEWKYCPFCGKKIHFKGNIK